MYLPSISNTPLTVSPITTPFKSYTEMASVNGSSRGYTPYTKTSRPQFKLTSLWRAHIHPKCSAPRLSIKYDTICPLPAPPSSHTRRQSSGHQTRPSTRSPPVVAYADDVTVLLPNLEISPSSTRPCDGTKKPPQPNSTHRNRRPFPFVVVAANDYARN